MKPSTDSSGIPKASPAAENDLEFPIEPGFRAFPPRIPLKDYCRRNRELRELFPKGVPTLEERWKRKVHVPFEL
jgi:hypothetical protein